MNARNRSLFSRIFRFGRASHPGQGEHDAHGGGQGPPGGCTETRAGASDYMDGDISPTLAARIRQHLGLCEGCEGWMGSLRATVGLVRGLPKEQAPHSLKQSIRSATRE